MIAAHGGSLFAREDFEQLQRAVLAVGETEIVVIQNTQDFTSGEPMFRMKFPATITWEEMISGNYISAVLLEMCYNEYYVFGSQGNWGKYSATDHRYPVDIIGFAPEVASIFQAQFEHSEAEKDELRLWLPGIYREVIR